MPPFSLWSFLQDGVCTIAISSYEKYKGGVSVRDVQALVQTAVKTRICSMLQKPYFSCSSRQTCIGFN
jgi:hypothetical protein